MHRYRLCVDLLNEITNGTLGGGNPAEAFATLYVWLRFSAQRQLTWQRNYNTQPRILSSAQHDLTLTIAHAHG